MNNSPSKEHSAADQIELLLKAATIGLGILYVLGLLITNAQLLQLGLADFSSLHARNIMTGFLFLLYLVFIFLLILPISTILSAWLYTLGIPKIGARRKLFLLSISAIAFLGAEFSFAATGGAIVGYLLPSGRPWSAGFNTAWTWTAQKSDSTLLLNQCLQAVWRQKALTAAIMLALFLVPLVYQFLKGLDRQYPSEQLTNVQIIAPKLYWRLFLFISLIALPLLLFDYADALYPNLQYNFGGGQPRIVRLSIESDETAIASLLGDQAPALADHKSKTLTSNPVALWYQDDKFFYLSPLATEGETKVLAIDSKTVHVIDYVSGYVKIGSGGRILSIHLPNSTIKNKPADPKG